MEKFTYHVKEFGLHSLENGEPLKNLWEKEWCGQIG